MTMLHCEECGQAKQANRTRTYKCGYCGHWNYYDREKPVMVSSRKKEVESLTRLWGQIVIARAGKVSELSKNTGLLDPHHLRGKSNYTLRFSLLNGYCCTRDEHIKGFHNEFDPAQIQRNEDVVRKQRGADIFEKLEGFKHIKSRKVNLDEVRINLENAAATYGIR